jgi:hypothetical protein
VSLAVSEVVADGSWNLFGQDQCSAIGMSFSMVSQSRLTYRLGMAIK